MDMTLRQGMSNRADKDHLLNSLFEEIQKRNLKPEDVYEVAALLESMGWNDGRARSTFGVDDIFELAHLIWDKFDQKIMYATFLTPEKPNVFKLLWELLRNFLRGVMFAFPMAVSVVAMLTLKYSLWSYENFSIDLGTVIAIGTILSFVTVGGFTQAIARRGFYYIFQGYYNMARKITFFFILVGFLVTVALCFAVMQLNTVFNLFPNHLLMILVLYFFFLTSIWLSVTVMYILQKEFLFSGLIVFGIFVVWLLFSVLHTGIILAQLAGLMTIAVLGLVLVLYLFGAAERKADKGVVTPKLPRWSVTIYSTFPYFLYGVIYFAFLYVDRLISWSTNAQYMPYPILFRGDYELGLDFALLILIIPMGVAEVILFQLMHDIQAAQKEYWASQIEKMDRKYTAIYQRRLVVISISSVISAALVYILARVLLRYSTSSVGKTLFTNPVTHFVFLWGVAAYIMVAIALLNSVTLFSLNRPDMVLKAIIPAFSANVLIGFLLTRWVSYSYAVFGLLAGALIFMLLSSVNALRVIRRLDFHLYSAS